MQVSKMVALPHINAVVACSGACAFFGRLVYLSVLRLGGIEAHLQAMPRVLRTALGAASELGRRLDLKDMSIFEKQRVVFVGWPKASRCIVARLYQKLDPAPDADFVEQDIPDDFLSPWDESFRALVLPHNDPLSKIVAVAAAQTHIARKEVPGGAGGGELIVAEITRAGMSIRPVCELPRRDTGVVVVGRAVAGGYELRRGGGMI